ncbi:hypothetical protein KM914_14505 [Virgibacillus pantothenticus]|uniref:hypothetical protein n=1 Tax=Virgibacillus TaxID=84406 RepID=UPI00067D0CAA|nr:MULTISPECIES: hypothetical protein [Virgibacillus]API93385.1 hypothetical protein BKP57_17135 [Virgibacillus sp. 6R]MBS7428554.1 hypothetical protein [Virgibacillus sp. 19R1-5]MBU8567629.1 hypothetical protein [Virgibacillus pantothenticus]MBU8601417.1 hypothetical protein [Virgibacillus pantothenticus]MBU8636234.1 hypothetical protein [Virgibacillus pantothenticus]
MAFISTLLGTIASLGITVGIVLLIMGAIKKKKYKGGMITLVSLVLFIIAAIITPDDLKEKYANQEQDKAEKQHDVDKQLNDDDDDDDDDDKRKKKSNELSSQQKKTIKSLQNFPAFTKEYKKLNDSTQKKTWDKHLSGKKVTWKGYVMEAKGKKVYVWGGDKYKDQKWSQVKKSKKNEAYQVFLADFGKNTPKKTLKAGDKVTIQGTLMSSGDAKQNLHWKLYTAKLMSK